MLKLIFNDSEIEYLVGFERINDNVVQISGDIPQDSSGFILSRVGKNDMWDYLAYRTIYRVPQNGVIQFSNDGSVYIPPRTDITISASWDDGGNIKEIRPTSVEVDVLVNGEKDGSVVLDEENGWIFVLKDVVAENVYTIEASDVAEYEKEIYGTNVTYRTNYPVPEELTVDDVAMAVAELADVVMKNSTDIVVTQNAVAEIYEMIVEE